MNHIVCLFIRERSKTRRHILEHLYEDATKSAEYHMSEPLLILGTDKQLRTLDHFLHHHSRSIGYLHQPVIFS